MDGGYLNLSQQELEARAETAYALYRECRVCPHRCGIDRTRNETGFCQQTDQLFVSSFVQHFGEEIPLTGNRGVGNLFITSCNMRCDYCQNFQISQERAGAGHSFESVAEEMVKLQSQGVHYIGWVSPSHVVPGLLKSLALARNKGLRIPIIYNSNGFDSLETLRLLDGIIDIYQPDLKYAEDAIARQYSHIRGYVESSREAVLEMYRQVGPMKVDYSGMAQRGLMVRHLVLPGGLAGTWEVLCFLALEVSPEVPLSLMSQYQPVHKALKDPVLSRTLTANEYENAIQMAEELGFETVYIQKLETELHNLPDFDISENPFPLQQAYNNDGKVGSLDNAG